QSAAALWAGWMWPMLWQSSLLILLVALLDRLIRRWAWPHARFALWSLVLLKLVLPPWLASPVSLTSALLPSHAKPVALVTNNAIDHPELVSHRAAAPLSLDLLDGPGPALRQHDPMPALRT